MNNLLIDIGNSEIKFGKGNPITGNVRLIKRSPYSKTGFKKDFTKSFRLSNVFSYERIGISLLKDGDRKFLNDFFKKKTNKIPFFIDRKLKLPVKIDYSDGIGNDRICNAWDPLESTCRHASLSIL